MASSKTVLSGTDLVHADDHIPHGLEVAPSISVTTSRSIRKLIVQMLPDVLYQLSETLFRGRKEKVWMISILKTLVGMYTLVTRNLRAREQSTF
jgi:hypothetical protein